MMNEKKEPVETFNPTFRTVQVGSLKLIEKGYACPNCGSPMWWSDRFNYCPICGQALKWETVSGICTD